MDSFVLKATWHTFKVVSLAKFLTDDNNTHLVDDDVAHAMRTFRQEEQ